MSSISVICHITINFHKTVSLIYFPENTDQMFQISPLIIATYISLDEVSSPFSGGCSYPVESSSSSYCFIKREVCEFRLNLTKKGKLACSDGGRTKISIIGS